MNKTKRLLYGPESFDFGQAIKHIKKGGMAARKGWNGKEMFIFLVEPKINGVDHMLSAPVLSHCVDLQNHEIQLLSFIAMRSATGDIVMGWLASQTDILSEDWTVVRIEHISENK